jgi:hypothetical protein
MSIIFSQTSHNLQSPPHRIPGVPVNPYITPHSLLSRFLKEDRSVDSPFHSLLSAFYLHSPPFYLPFTSFLLFYLPFFLPFSPFGKIGKKGGLPFGKEKGKKEVRKYDSKGNQKGGVNPLL